jgi:hypothetical protein
MDRDATLEQGIHVRLGPEEISGVERLRGTTEEVHQLGSVGFQQQGATVSLCFGTTHGCADFPLRDP